MRKLTEKDVSAIIGTNVEGYEIIKARIKRGDYSDSDNYGVVLARNTAAGYETWVTWQFHLVDEKPNMYWGRYFMEDKTAAMLDFNARDMPVKTYTVEITETLQLYACCEAHNPEEAESIVRSRYNAGDYILGSEHFTGVEFNTLCKNHNKEGDR